MKVRLRLFLLRLLGWLAPLFAGTPRSGESRRILVIKPDHLGDMLLATPALRELRRRFPDAHITALVGPWARFVLDGNNVVDTVHTLAFPGFERKDESRAVVGWRLAVGGRNRTKDERRKTKDESNALRHLVSRLLSPYILLLRYGLLLRRGGYDAALILRDDHWWGAALALMAGIPRRIGYAAPACRPLLTDALPWNADEHVTIQGLRLVAALAGETIEDSLAPQFRSDDPMLQTEAPRVPGADSWAESWLRERGVAPDEQLVIIHPGTGGQSKLWLPERWSAVGTALQALPKTRVLVTGGPGEEALVDAVAADMAQPPLTLAGTATVGQLTALLRRATLVLGVDSGPLHLAVAAGAPTIHLYGPGDAGRFGPWGDRRRQVVLRVGLFCSPCGVFTFCPRGTRPSECMALIGAEQVIAKARSVLAVEG